MSTEVNTDSNMSVNSNTLELPAVSKKESQGFIEDLGKVRTFELKDLLERQEKLLSNKFVISKLVDKGEKLKAFKEKIIEELDHRNEIDNAARLLSKLNIAKDGKSAMNQLEWTGKYSEADTEEKIVELDSDDDEDPIKILAQPTGTGVHKKKIIHIPKEESLITPEDLERIESFNSSNSSDLEHVKRIVNIVENPNNEKSKEKFMPYKTTRSNVHDPMKEKARKKGKHWEVTAATPPHIIHGAVKCISINESMELQKEQAEKLSVIQLEHAAKRLAEKFEIHNIGSLPTTNLENYRTKANSDSESSAESADEDEEVYDEESIDKGRTVVYSVHNFT